MLRSVIFDLDGLLIDSEQYWREATAEFFKKHNKIYTDAISEKIMGMGLKEITEFFKAIYGFSGSTEALVEERRGLMYELLMKNLTLMPGAKRLITYLSSRHIPLSIATSGHTKEKTKEIVERLGIRDYFAAFISGDDFKKAKPAPDMYLAAAQVLHTDPENCLVFEDAPSGVLAGKAAGMRVYAVNTDEMLQEKLRTAGADSVFSSLEDVPLGIF